MVLETNEKYLIVDIEDTVLDFLVDFLGGVDEGFLDVGCRLGGRLHEDEAVLPRERLALLSLHVPPCLQITATPHIHFNQTLSFSLWWAHGQPLHRKPKYE